MLETDALNRAIEACISQLDNKKCLHLIAFYSQKFQAAEMNYKIHNKKLLAIVNIFKQ